MKVTIHVDDDQWRQLLDEVNIDKAKHPQEHDRAVARLVRDRIFLSSGPNPRSVIHAIKAEEKGAEPPAQSKEALDDLRSRIKRIEGNGKK